MNTEKTEIIDEFKIPFGTNKGYPFHCLPSRVSVPNRVELTLSDDKRVFIDVDTEVFPTFNQVIDEEKIKGDEPTQTRTAFEDFLLFRLYEVTEALNMAEGQIIDIFKEKPFIPEAFGFYVAHKNQSIFEQPVRIYFSQYNPKIALFRKPADVNDKSWDPSIWTVQVFGEDGVVVRDEDVTFPSHRVAYSYFLARRIQVEDQQTTEELTTTNQ